MIVLLHGSGGNLRVFKIGHFYTRTLGSYGKTKKKKGEKRVAYAMLLLRLVGNKGKLACGKYGILSGVSLLVVNKYGIFSLLVKRVLDFDRARFGHGHRRRLQESKASLRYKNRGDALRRWAPKL